MTSAAAKILFGDPNRHCTEYSANTLVGNWYEQRWTKPGQNTTERVHARDVAPEATMQLDLRTTKQAMDNSVATSTPPAKVTRPSMFTPRNLMERLATYGTPPAVAYTMGRIETLEKAAVPDRHMETTHHHFFDKLPEQAKATTSDPAHFATDKTFHRKPLITRDAYETTKPDLTKEFGGAKGARGEMTRNPAEAGNVYGVSVFVDEYSKWKSGSMDKAATATRI